MDEFKTGQTFTEITSDHNDWYRIGYSTPHGKPVSITCIMESGEMAYVAWFIVEFDNPDSKPVKLNGKFVVSIR